MQTERDPVLARRLQTIGNNIHSLRAERGLTQEALADAAGLHRTYIGSVERGERNLAVGNLFALAAALGVTITELISGNIPCPDARAHASAPSKSRPGSP